MYSVFSRSSDWGRFLPLSVAGPLRGVLQFLVMTLMVSCGSGGGSAPLRPTDAANEVRTATLSAGTGVIHVPVHVILARGPGGASTAEAEEILSRATATLERQLPVRFAIASFEEMPDPVPELRDPATQDLLITAWEAWSREKGKLSKRSIEVVLVPPYEEHGQYLFGGVASGNCSFPRRDSIVVSAVGPRTAGTNPEDRVEKSAKSLAHELAHILGAGHTRDESLMAPVLNFPITPELALSAASIAEVARCLG